jgi:DNA-binding NarL/FixJ family response regulator
MKLFLASIATGIFVTTSTFMTVVFVRALFKDEASVMLLKEAADGGSPMSPEVARRVIDLFREIKPPKEAEYDLTPHELRLLRMLVEGHSYKTAAAELQVSVNTIKFHLRHIYDKLQVHTKSEAVAKALRHGLTR